MILDRDTAVRWIVNKEILVCLQDLSSCHCMLVTESLQGHIEKIQYTISFEAAVIKVICTSWTRADAGSVLLVWAELGRVL